MPTSHGVPPKPGHVGTGRQLRFVSFSGVLAVESLQQSSLLAACVVVVAMVVFCWHLVSIWPVGPEHEPLLVARGISG